MKKLTNQIAFFFYCDIFVVTDIKKINDNLKKNKVKKGIGLEVTIADLRKADGLQVGKWFNQIRDLYKFCRSTNCQFILSSGANSVWKWFLADLLIPY